MGASQKSYNHRTSGLTRKFSKGDDLLTFQSALIDRLEDNGMDTTTYMPHPKHPTATKMVSVVLWHSSFNMEKVKEHSDRQAALWDDYDKANDKTATDCLIASLQTELGITIKKKKRKEDTFAVVWMTLLRTIQSSSFEVYEIIKTRIKSRRVSHYAGQDLSLLATDFQDDAKLLTKAGFYDHSLTLVMLKMFLEAGGDGRSAENFRYKLQGWIEDMAEAIFQIRFMTDEEKEEYIEKNDLTYRDITDKVEGRYRDCVDANEWSPAKNVRDAKAPPATFGANVAASE